MTTHMPSTKTQSRLCVMPTGNPRRLGSGISAQDAALEFAVAKVEPLEPFISALTRIKCRCLVCGTEGKQSLTLLRQVGKSRKVACVNTGRKVVPGSCVDLFLNDGRRSCPTGCTCGRHYIDPAKWNLVCGVKGCTNIKERTERNKGDKGSWQVLGYEWVCTTHYNRWVSRSDVQEDVPIGSKMGLDPTAPAALYLVKREGVVKVGILTRKARIKDHTSEGWTVARTWEFPTGAEARKMERAVLHHWRKDLNARWVLSPEDMPQGGYRETASIRKVGLKRTTDYINEMIAA